MKASLSTEKISKKFDGIYAVKDLSVELFPGQITGVIGPNGSGKTTFINLITGRYFTDSGTIVLPSGHRTHHLKTHRAAPNGITRTFQSVHLFYQMSVLDNLYNVVTPRNPLLALFSRRRRRDHHRVAEVLKELGLWEKRKELVQNLSYGQRKLLEIGRTLMVEAQVYCFDEPYAGLFPAMIERVKAIFLRLKAEGKCILWVEHNINLIKELSDRVLFMDQGTLLADGPANKVFNLPEVLEAYLGH